MKLASDFQVTSDGLSAAEVEKTQTWLKQAVGDYERKDPDWVSKYLEDGIKLQVFSLGTVAGMDNFEKIVAWEYQAHEGGQAEFELKSLHLTREELSAIVEGRFVYPSGLEEPFSWDIKIQKKIDSDKWTGGTFANTGAAPDLYEVWRKKVPFPSLSNPLQ
ncbi:hypothetical protein BKA70DRAFT_1432236 [Coprinopsis sp. MPI-PUGE-AT-0042]|nr:hypothetical protein BKA70DRAFT_1432236 [Coprinopsis sp. MPI-PUGE-AT-0042]